MRNLYWLALPAALALLVLSVWRSPAEDKAAGGGEPGFAPLFDLPKFGIYNGTARRWAFTGDGVIVAEGDGGGWLMHPRPFGDLELRLEYRMTRGGNSGLTLHNPLEPPEGLS